MDTAGFLVGFRELLQVKQTCGNQCRFDLLFEIGGPSLLSVTLSVC